MASTSLDSERENRDKKRRREEMDPFLSAMTFAAPESFVRDCDCDECVMIPPSIVEAIRRHKRLKAATTPMRRTQDRRLVARRGAVSIWKLTMPLDAEPLIEYGNGNRIMLVDRLAQTSKINSIGKGIVGSSAEEMSRTSVPWEQGRAYFIPENGGKALGWIHEHADESSEEVEASGHAVVYAIKFNKGQDKVHGGNSSPGEWDARIRSFFTALATSTEKEAYGMSGTSIGDDIYQCLAEIVRELES